MKQHHLSTKFLRFYILIGILGFFLITLGGSYMVEKHLEHSLSAALYTEAHNIASNEAVKGNISSSTVDTLQEHLCAISDFQDAVLWIINSNGEIIVSTQKNIDVRDPIPLEEFDASKWGSNYYQIGKFYGFFKTDHLSVIAPITSDMETKGYVAIHYSMTNLYQSRSSILFIMQVIFLLCYAATSLLLWAYSHYIRKPLARIMKGASEYAGGNLAYKIDVTSDDEMGYLAKTLNYMSDELNKNGEYQRKFIANVSHDEIGYLSASLNYMATQLKDSDDYQKKIVANVSHDFRSPLTSIKGYVNAILDGTIPYEMQERYLKIIAFESERLEKLTRSLLTLNELDMKKRMMHIQRFDINDTIKNTAATFEGICTSRQIRLELLLSGHELYVRADMEQIQQVLYNLLDNAIKFSNDNSSVQIETTVKSGKVFVSVKDYGTGIPKESLGKIWDRFYKIDASRGKDRKGTGLGLSIVKEIINAHNQNIDVISTEGVGTEFIFTLEKTK